MPRIALNRGRDQSLEGGGRAWLLRGLKSIGVDVSPAPLGDPRESLTVQGVSKGVIEVKGQPIAWIHLRTSPEEINLVYSDYAVPDERLSRVDVRYLHIDSHKFWLPLGVVKTLRWTGADCDLKVRKSLARSSSLRALWLEPLAPSVRILANSSPFSCWRIAVENPYWMSRPVSETGVHWRRHWSCLKALAIELLRADF